MRDDIRRPVVGLVAVMILGLWHLTDVRSAVYATGDSWLTGGYAVLTAAVLFSLAFLGVLFYGLRRKAGQGRRPFLPERVYPAAGLLLGLIFLVVLPPLCAPDEISHYVSAYRLSNALMGKEATDRYGRVLFDVQDVWVEDIYGDYAYERTEEGVWKAAAETFDANTVLGKTLTEDTYACYHALLTDDSFRPGQTEAFEGMPADSPNPPVTTTPLAYLPQALFMTAARLLSLGTLPMLFLGRLGNLLFFVGMTWLAMRRLPFGKEVLFGFALLPMTLHLSASYSYDAMLMGCFFLFGAVCLDLAYQKERVSWKDILLLVVLMAAAGPCKMVYAALMGLCLLIPVRKFGGWKGWILSAAAVVLAWAAAMVAVNCQLVMTYVEEAETYVAWAAEPGYSLKLLFHQPMLLIRMFYQTILWQAESFHLTMIGASLGDLDPVLDVPYLLVVAFSLGLLCLTFRKPGETLFIRGGKRIWIFVVCAVCAAAILGSMLIAWTPLSARVISGVQGRYFLPFLPVLLMALKNDTVVLTKNPNCSILYVMCCMDGYVLLRLYSIVSMRV
ncbi:MAG: DUF2142 domain-containing protein [Clostridiales bacterium]|nr:DUF2142 domain-containing protein [Clostridiales bacterium]